jgi:hypothetical protein
VPKKPNLVRKIAGYLLAGFCGILWFCAGLAFIAYV